VLYRLGLKPGPNMEPSGHCKHIPILLGFLYEM
jgi:hypothetical protein